MRGTIRVAITVAALALSWAVAPAQTVTVLQNVNLRPDPSSKYPSMRLLKPSEPPLTLLDPTPEAGFYHVRTSVGEEGYVWGHYVQVVAAPAATAATLQPGPGVPGSTSMVGCGDGLWKHVYHPSRLLVKQDCVTVTGTIVDATAHLSHHQADGVRHEGDGDTHGWLKVDPPFAALINAGNVSDEEGNLVRSHNPMRSPRAPGSPITRRFRSAPMWRSRGHSCRTRITRSGTSFTRYHASRCSNQRKSAALNNSPTLPLAASTCGPRSRNVAVRAAPTSSARTVELANNG